MKNFDCVGLNIAIKIVFLLWTWLLGLIVCLQQFFVVVQRCKYNVVKLCNANNMRTENMYKE